MIRREGLIILSFLVVLFACQDVFSGKTPIESLVSESRSRWMDSERCP